MFDPGSWKTGRPGNLGFVHRGLAYWTDGSKERLLLGTGDAYLIAVDAQTGTLDPSFGDGGRVDLMAGVARATRATTFSNSSAPIVCRDVVIVGASVHDGPTTKEWPRGDVTGFDVRTGQRLWTFHSIPEKGEFGHDTWSDDAAEYTGSTNVWTTMSADDALGLVYLPFGTPTNDFYGGHRPGANLFAEWLVALDAKTGSASLALPGGAPRRLGLRPAGGADAGRHHGRRTAHQGRGAGQQAGLHLRLRSANRQAGVADRRAAGAAIDGAGRALVADAADSLRSRPPSSGRASPTRT